MLSTNEIRLISKAMFIIQILNKVRNNPDAFALNNGRVIWDDRLKCKAISKDEILAWQHANAGGDESYKMTSQEFDEMLPISGIIATIKHGNLNYHCLS
jgi:hypothetical protein